MHVDVLHELVGGAGLKEPVHVQRAGRDDNLPLLCGACNRRIGTETQAKLIAKPQGDGVGAADQTSDSQGAEHARPHSPLREPAERLLDRLTINTGAVRNHGDAIATSTHLRDLSGDRLINGYADEGT